ncbi:hypothetical protein GCM10028798_03690 [Humibacter antri]
MSVPLCSVEVSVPLCSVEFFVAVVAVVAVLFVFAAATVIHRPITLAPNFTRDQRFCLSEGPLRQAPAGAG